MLIFIPTFKFLIAFALAGLEVEVEGRRGWAAGMPTCRLENRWAVLALKPFFGGRPVTLYHCYMFSLVTLMWHIGYVQGVPMTWANEWRCLSTLFLLCATWDFLWFVLNPAYGLENFRREKVAWHAGRPWVFGLFPIDYAIAFVLSLAFSMLAWVSADATVFDVVDGVMGYFLWFFLLGTAIEIGKPYRKWRAGKKPESAYHASEDPPTKGWIDSP